MDTILDIPDLCGNGKRRPQRPIALRKLRAAPATLTPWLRAQAINVTRHAAALRLFRRDEFGASAAAPTEGHIRSTNELIAKLRKQLLKQSARVQASMRAADQRPSSARLQQAMRRKDAAYRWVRLIEEVWDHYFELFSQRHSVFGDWLLSCDRIALDCYQAAYTGLGKARSIPAPPPFSYMRRGRSPATFRRGIRLRRLGSQLNPFPLVQLPYHRLVNPWTLGAVLHEVSHNLQNDLGLARVIPDGVARRLLAAGFPRSVAAIWRRWNRETFADLSGLLLGGPAVVESLYDVIGRSPQMVFSYNPRGPHPTPYLRALLSVELLRRMGFPAEAAQFRRQWQRMYPDPHAGNIPAALLKTFDRAHRLVVDVMCFQKYPSLGDKSLSQVYCFTPKDQTMVEEAAGRLASGTEPGVLPERFFIGAARLALDRGLARPGVITDNFYRALARR